MTVEDNKDYTAAKSYEISKAEGNTAAGKAEVGDTINYTVTVTNTGNVATGEVVLTDTFTGSGSLQGDAVTPGEGGKAHRDRPSAEVGESSRATYSYVVQANDKEISNAIGTEPGQKTDVTVEDNKDYTAAKSYEISKAEGNTAAGKAEVGDTINYTVTVTNTGNVATGEVVLTDTFTGSGSLQGDAVTPARGRQVHRDRPERRGGRELPGDLLLRGQANDKRSQRHRHRARQKTDVTVEDNKDYTAAKSYEISRPGATRPPARPRWATPSTTPSPSPTPATSPPARSSSPTPSPAPARCRATP